MEKNDKNDLISNRDKKKAPKFKTFWCMACDRDMVQKGQKCGTCGARAL